MSEQQTEQQVYSDIDLAPMRTFLVTSILEMAVGLQETHADIGERADDAEYRGEYFRILGGIAGCATNLAIINGGKAAEFAILCNKMQQLVMMEFDRIRSETTEG